MERLGAYTLTGRRADGPATDLVELVSDKGLKLLALVTHPRFRGNAVVNAALKRGERFLKDPGHPGVLPLAMSIPEEGALIYPSGTAWSVAELVLALDELGHTAGVRAGLELCYQAAQMLLEAADKGAEFDFWSHGSLDPWKILVKPDGTVRIIGYGMPQVEILRLRENERDVPDVDAFRYCPPERLEGGQEDIHTDLLSLSLVGLELMTGRPVYDGLASDVRQQAARAEGAYRLYKWRDQIPEAAREILGRALKFDADSRHADPLDYVYGLHDLLQSPDIDGPGLADIVALAKEALTRGEVIVGGHTSMLSKAELARLAADLDDEVDPKPLAPPLRPRPAEQPDEPEDGEPRRWGAVARAGRRGASAPEPPPPAPSPTPTAAGGGRADDLRARLGRSGSSAPAPEPSSRDDLRARLGRSAPPSQAAPVAAAPSPGRADDLRARLGRSSPPSQAPAPEPSARDDLRARLGRSSPSAPAPAPAPDPRADLKARLGRSGGGESDARDDLRARLGRSGGAAAVEPDARADLKARLEAGRVDRDDDSDELDGAAALLARLRSSAGGAPEAVAPPSAEPEAEPAAIVVPDPEDFGPVPEPESEPEPAPPPAASVPTPPAPPARVASPPPPEPDPEDTELEIGEPDEEPLTAPPGAPSLGFLQVRVGARMVALPAEGDAGQAAAALVARVGPPTDLLGQLNGWWRLAEGGARLAPGDSLAGRAGASFEAVRVPARIVRAMIAVEGSEPSLQVETLVSTVVPAATLLEHLRSWLGLSGNDWSLYLGSSALSPMQILDDHDPRDGIRLVVKR